MTIFWFRRDLRLEDNRALYEALRQSEQVLPIFIFDSDILDQLPSDDARVHFISHTLTDIQRQLMQINRSLAVFAGTVEDVFLSLLQDFSITDVFTNEDYEPYATHRDTKIASLLRDQNVSFQLYKDQVIFEKDEIVKDDGTPYVVFTPYANKWKAKCQSFGETRYPSEMFLNRLSVHSFPFFTAETLGFKPTAVSVPDFDLSSQMMESYHSKRNFPAESKTSGLSTHLRFGTISIRRVVSITMKHNDTTFLNELIWREFFMQILWHFPHTVTRSFRSAYDNIIWRNDPEEFQQWCDGNTGYPLVDAGMRQLKATGLMHNRVRMVVASFLCKHLLIDWRWGEAWFAERLLDYEQSSNVGNWQWAAGSGVDAAPYFRIFNPSEQARKFDSKGIYIRRWVPEFDSLQYNTPIVDHVFARERCLRTYRQALEH